MKVVDRVLHCQVSVGEGVQVQIAGAALGRSLIQDFVVQSKVSTGREIAGMPVGDQK